MRTIFGSLFLLALTTNAFAYNEGTYSCKNAEGLPNNTYKIENVAVGGATLPYVEVNRFYKGKEGQPPTQSSIRGLAAVSTSESVEILSLAALRLEFENGALVNCRQ
jgi:hypothetical protein